MNLSSTHVHVVPQFYATKYRFHYSNIVYTICLDISSILLALIRTIQFLVPSLLVRHKISSLSCNVSVTNKANSMECLLKVTHQSFIWHASSQVTSYR